MKICLISSSGGHWSQLEQFKSILENFNCYWITEKVGKEKNAYFLLQQDRKKIYFLVIFLLNIFISFYYLLKFRPNVIISTGAGGVIPFCILGKLFGAKLIYLESFAKINHPTITGRILYRFADKFYVQWEELLKEFPKAIYRGGIY